MVKNLYLLDRQKISSISHHKIQVEEHFIAEIKGENIETEITVGIEDAYFGTEKKISLRTVNRKNENFFCKNPIRN